MRVSITNVNGMSCDNCGKLVRAKSSQMRKIQCLMPHSDDKKASTGIMQNIGKIDLCVDCYNALLGELIRKPRNSGKVL